ncbi:ubiE/COQ5 methyltransferase family protein [Burkholderia sp. OK233]|nr:ubiE/COQ5 methyltransferase family protein [Burkholderia sp. OK233]
MTDTSKFQFTNPSVPKAYEEYFVPRLFEPWARLLLDEAKLVEAQAIVDVATGSGTVARLAAPTLGPKGRIVATDIACTMLDIARAKPSLTGAAPIEYIESPAAPLAASTGEFDVVFCQRGLQFFPDRLSALREMRRVLKPDGRVVSAVWASIERNPIFAAMDGLPFLCASDRTGRLNATKVARCSRARPPLLTFVQLKISGRCGTLGRGSSVAMDAGATAPRQAAEGVDCCSRRGRGRNASFEASSHTFFESTRR